MKAGLVFLCMSSAALAQQPTAAREHSAAQEDVELVRDRWGIPHVFAATDEGAMYGLGHACAEDRAFQMYFALRIMQGRLAELLGDRKSRDGRRTAVHNDRKMRTFGWWRHARVVARNLPPETRRLLHAFSAGVNDWLTEHRGDLPQPFGSLGVEPERWTPAACLVSWWHLAQFFAADGTRDLIAWRNELRPPPGERPPRVAPDDEAAIIQRSDVTEEWVARVEAFVATNGLRRAREAGQAGRKFSHAWVVGGGKTTSGSAVLVSDPQTPVTNPSLFYEFHVHGETFDARGIGVAGSPIILIGFNRDVAWGMTARGADQADLFRLRTDRRRPGQYELDGEWLEMQRRRETIRVRGGPGRGLEIRETVFGPVVSEFAFRRASEPEVALRRVPLADTRVETVQAAFAMMRADNVRAFAAALRGWRFPTANCLYGDRHGDIGYATIGAIPVRSPKSTSLGRAAHDGHGRRFDWRGYVPGELMPQVVNPARGFILSGNHRPIASFYAIPFGGATGVAGDTLRSWRLRELLQAKAMFTPEDVLKIHYDTTNAAKREIVRIGLHLRDTLGIRLEPDANRALGHLEPWFRLGAPSDLRQKGAALASQIQTGFRRNATRLTLTYGGGQSGLARFLKATQRRFARTPEALVDAYEWEYAERLLQNAWRAAQRRWGDEPDRWCGRARDEISTTRLGWFAGLDGFPSLDESGDMPMPDLYCVDGNTIHSQRAQSYTQWVPLHDVDQAKSICPIGQAERPGQRSRSSTYELWRRGELHPAPLSRSAVAKVRASSTLLRFGR